MKKTIYSLLALLGILSSCSSQKQLVDTAPFEIGRGFSQEWVGGKERSGKGVLVKIPVSELGEYTINSIYFRGQHNYVKVVEEKGQKYVVANLKKQLDKGPHDIIADADPKKEFGNKPTSKSIGTEKKIDFPFKLDFNEAVLSYIKNNTIKYVKVTNIKDKPILIYSSKPRE